MNHQVLFDLRCLHDLLPCSIRKTRCPACCHVAGYADHGGLVLCGMENQGQGKSMDSKEASPAELACITTYQLELFTVNTGWEKMAEYCRIYRGGGVPLMSEPSRSGFE